MKSEPPSKTRLDTPSSRTPWLSLVIALAIPATVLAQGTGTPAGTSPVSGSVIAFCVILVILIIALNGLAVAGENALEILRSSHMRHLEKDSKHHGAIHNLVDRRVYFLASCTVASLTFRAWLIILCGILAYPLAAPVMDSLQLSLWGALALASLAVAIPVVGLNIIFGELVPKSYGMVHPIKTLVRINKFVRAFGVFFGWQGHVLAGLANRLTRRFGVDATFEHTRAAEEEIKILVQTAEETGQIEEEESRLINSVFAFNDTIAREIMTPRVDLDAVSVETPLEEIARLIRETGHSRIPIFEDTDDQIIGVIHAKDLLHLDLSAKKNLRTLLRPPLFVPENKNLFDLLKEMKTARTQIAIVTDEFGGTAGVVTVEDIVEELVGEIIDEYDSETPDVVSLDSGYSVNGKLNIDDFNEAVGTQLESEEFDTVGGYLFGAFGRSPQPGEQICLEDWVYTVEQMDGRRIGRIRVAQADPDHEELTASG